MCIYIYMYIYIYIYIERDIKKTNFNICERCETSKITYIFHINIYFRTVLLPQCICVCVSVCLFADIWYADFILSVFHLYLKL